MTASRDTGTQHKLRMPPELKEKLFKSSKEMNRSLNAEIVHRLEQSFGVVKINDLSPSQYVKHLQFVDNLEKINSDRYILVDKNYLKELLKLKNSLKDLSLAVLELEEHSLDFKDEEFLKDQEGSVNTDLSK